MLQYNCGCNMVVTHVANMRLFSALRITTREQYPVLVLNMHLP